MNLKGQLLLILTYSSFFFFFGCQSDNYEMADYYKVKKIDAHLHLNSESNSWIELAKEDNFRLLSINVDYPDFNSLEEQYRIAVEHRKNDPKIFAFVSSFHMAGWDNPDWVTNTIKHLDSTFTQGAIAVKVWKNIGMSFRDNNNKLVMIDDPQFDPIFKYLKEKDIPLIGHLGEPKDCWQPVDKMINNDMKEYFGNHPQYHMYLHPDMPSYEEQMAARDRMLEKNKKLCFMGAHIASLEWSLDELSKFFERFPDASVDLAARMGYVQYYTAQNREKTRDFFIKYQDRILYATDNIQEPDSDPNIFKKVAHDKWLSDWKFLVTDSTMTSTDIDMPFNGLKLPQKVIDKIYRENAEKLFTKAWK